MEEKTSINDINSYQLNTNLQSKIKTQETKKITKTIDLGDYLLTNYKIGKGAFSTIYLGEDKTTKKNIPILDKYNENFYHI